MVTALPTGRRAVRPLAAGPAVLPLGPVVASTTGRRTAVATLRSRTARTRPARTTVLPARPVTPTGTPGATVLPARPVTPTGTTSAAVLPTASGTPGTAVLPARPVTPTIGTTRAPTGRGGSASGMPAGTAALPSAAIAATTRATRTPVLPARAAPTLTATLLGGTATTGPPTGGRTTVLPIRTVTVPGSTGRTPVLPRRPVRGPASTVPAGGPVLPGGPLPGVACAAVVT
ncbi:hypothetical protein SAMN05660324_0126 [Klenkia brasiliensis]|uniref:Uncharacterized protein n=1 Tax=Klenkia brasiliensis TaxID=333142 RepID=A0A1G8AEQ6_9ACTN|nr:hypothetical protein SAMN05660324_0126 [Klenkia brasiliensis]